MINMEMHQWLMEHSKMISVLQSFIKKNIKQMDFKGVKHQSFRKAITRREGQMSQKGRKGGQRYKM
jgi:hypothetical protein